MWETEGRGLFLRVGGGDGGGGGCGGGCGGGGGRSGVGRRAGSSRCHLFSQLLVPAHLLGVPFLGTEMEDIVFVSSCVMLQYSIVTDDYISRQFVENTWWSG